MRENEDGSPWEPSDGDRVCSAHFISGKKSDDACNPDFVPSVYPKTASKKPSQSTAKEESVACFKRAKQQSLAKEKLELEEKEKEVVKKKEEERSAIANQYVLKTFQHDHGSYFSSRNHSTSARDSTASPCSLYLQSSRSNDERAICAEIGESSMKFCNLSIKFY